MDLYNLAVNPDENKNAAAAHPDKVAAMQERLNVRDKESAKPLALMCVAGAGLAHGKHNMTSEDRKVTAPAMGSREQTAVRGQDLRLPAPGRGYFLSQPLALMIFSISPLAARPAERNFHLVR